MATRLRNFPHYVKRENRNYSAVRICQVTYMLTNTGLLVHILQAPTSDSLWVNVKQTVTNE